MRRRHVSRTRLLSLLTIPLVAALYASFAPVAHAWTSPDKATTPIIFVHGYNNSLGCPSVDEAMWNALKGDLVEDGWTGPKRAVGFYSCDKNVASNDWIDQYGSHSTYYATSPCSPVCSTHEYGTSGHLSHNRNTDLRHLAYHLAWFIYQNYSKHGQNVQVVAHSMGGLIVRWMLYAEQNNSTIGQGLFPPKLLVQDVYTISTMHNGVIYAFAGSTWQAEQMQSGSSFINAINATSSGRDPQATNGTDWTTMGNYPADADFVVGDTSAMHMDGGHKLLYVDPRYTHGGSLNDTNESWDALTYRCDGCGAGTSISTYRTVGGMPHNDGYVDQALYHNCLYCWPSLPMR
ncbi:MAG TPA: hypothetical protein VFU88_03550 [Ktedonobacterales bacterium]|nr:hypothetical protein [Ktedonobacterales bacterium]